MRDGEWIPDLLAHEHVWNQHGTLNSVVEVRLNSAAAPRAPALMVSLAATGHAALGYDTVVPGVQCHEATRACEVDWGRANPNALCL